MNSKTSIYTSPSLEEIENFLISVDTDFPIPLSKKTRLDNLSKKFFDTANCFAIKKDGKIVSAVFGYIDNAFDDLAYISVVATLRDYRGQGYSKTLVTEFSGFAELSQKSGVHLYCDASNKPALSMYKKLGFSDYIIKDELRPSDCHLIKRFEGKQ